MARIEWRPWTLVASFGLVLFLLTAATYNALGVVLPNMVKEEGWSWTEAGFGFTLLAAATGGSSFIPPILIRKFGVRATLLLGTSVVAVGFVCLAETHGTVVYFAGTGLCGVGFQMMALIPATHVLAAHFKHRALPFGLYFTAGALGAVAGPLIVLGLMHLFHDRWRLFWFTQVVIVGGAGVLCAALAGNSASLAVASARTDSQLAQETRASSSRVYRTAVDWTAREALATPQFYVLLAAYFGHLLIGAAVSSISVAHLTERGVSVAIASAMLSIEALMQTLGRSVGGLIGDLIDPRHLLIFALAAMAVGSAALSVAGNYPTMMLYAVGSGVGFGVALLSITMILLNYYGRKHNLEIFSITCLIGAVSALAPTIGGLLRDMTGSFTFAFQLFAGAVLLIMISVVFMRPPRHNKAHL